MVRRYKLLIIVSTVYFSLLFITWKITSGQWRIDTGAKVRVAPNGAVHSVRYGYSNRLGTSSMWIGSRSVFQSSPSRLLSSEGRYLSMSSGLLPTQKRFARSFSAPLPSGGRVGNLQPRTVSKVNFPATTIPYTAMGSIRYGSKPSSQSQIFQPSPTVKPVKVATSTLPLSQRASSSLRSPLVGGSIRYGRAKTSFLSSPLTTPVKTSPNNITPLVTPKTNQFLTGTNNPILNLKTHHSLNGSIRYTNLFYGSSSRGGNRPNPKIR